MKWLLNNLLNDHIVLSDVQRAKVHKRVAELNAMRPWSNLIGLIPGLLPLLMIPVWMRWARFWSVPWRFAFELAFALCSVALVFWIIRRRYQRHAYRAVRELGFDICPRCGYTLRGLGDDVQHCPECGSEREVVSTSPAEHHSH